MDLEPQSRKVASKIAEVPEATEKFEATEGMTERDHKTNDLKDSPLKIFMNTEIFILLAGLVVGAIYFFFFRT
ncbi:hypothetical protein [Bdellovibrio svalbardensis]|uniref:Uncharacterized protein n=1 Tax=Bdellovibrio svalbardensis TaxID=2972972 RepID=A0ABT6DMM9_9BACT|nr:hypothetical protein [Bdellovibrio svalbardensis]MDG0818127.1 hypothetical protein [Bdellovibrio svalbardensis]